MLEYATYSVISPEGCASILWRDDGKKPEAAAAMKMTATDLLRLGVVDEVVPEAPGGAHRDHDASAKLLGEALRRHLAELLIMPPEKLREDRYRKFRHMGAFVESGDKNAAAASGS
jgi:acetyl-CoA carboxylase carboxyl transferase subunit alpha